MIKVIVVRVGRTPVVEDIPSDLAAYQLLVGGYVQCVTLPGGLVLWCREEGKLLGLPFNRFVLASTPPLEELAEEIVGDFIVTRADTTGEEVDVIPGDLEALAALLVPLEERQRHEAVKLNRDAWQALPLVGYQGGFAGSSDLELRNCRCCAHPSTLAVEVRP